MNNDVGRRLAAVLDHLGIQKAHIAAGGIAAQAFDLMRLRPEMVASITFVPAPLVLDHDVARPFAERILCITGGNPAPAQGRSLETLRGWTGPRIIELLEYPSTAWADFVRDNSDTVIDGLLAQMDTDEVPALRRAAEEGEVDGVRFRVEGAGPPLLLFPLGLAPTQWDAAIAALSERFTTVRLGGRHIGFVQLLEERATEGTYIQGVRMMFDLLNIRPDDRVLEVGTGTGALARDLAGGRYAPAEVLGVDVNEFLLDEARFLSPEQTLGSTLRFQYGNAEALPFEDGTFDVAFAATVFEECDADRGIAELHRVLKPGGRAGVIVRSADLPWRWNLDLSEAVSRKVNTVFPQSVGATGCVDASLYSRFARRFNEVTPNPFWRCVTELPEGILGQTTALLDADEEREFSEALAAGRAAGTAFAATSFHCVVGTKR